MTLLAAHHGLRLFPAQPHRLERAAHRSSGRSRRPISRASACGRCAPRSVVLATGAIERPLVFPGNDRPGIMLAGAAQTYLNRYGVRVGDRAWSSSPRAMPPIKRHSICRPPAWRSPPSPIVRAAADRRPARGGAPRRHRRCCRGSTVLGTEGDLRVARHRARRGRRRRGVAHRAPHRLRCGADVRRLHAERAFVLAIARQARLERSRCRPSCRAARRSASARPAPAAASTDLGAGAGGRRGRAALRRSRRSARAALEPALRGRRHGASRRRVAVDGYLGALPQAEPAEQREILRRLAARCHRARSAARHARRLSIDRARQALHHHGHGHRSGQDLEPQCAWRSSRKDLDVPIPAGRAHHLSHALHADHLRQLRRHLARRSVRSGAHDADPRVGGGARARCSRMSGLWKRARYFPRGGEDMHAAVARECLAVRSACGIFDASTLGKIEVVGADAAEFMNRLYINSWSSSAWAARATASCAATTASSTTTAWWRASRRTAFT